MWMSLRLCSAMVFTIAEGVDADAAEQVEVAVAVFGDEMHVFTVGEEDRVALIGLKQQL